MFGIQPSEFWGMSPMEVLFFITVKARNTKTGKLSRAQRKQVDFARKRLEAKGVTVA